MDVAHYQAEISALNPFKITLAQTLQFFTTDDKKTNLII